MVRCEILIFNHPRFDHRKVFPSFVGEEGTGFNLIDDADKID